MTWNNDDLGFPAAYPPNSDLMRPRGVGTRGCALGACGADAAELGFSFKHLLKSAGKVVHVVAPIVKAVGVVTAFVIPPAGIAITAAAAGADALVTAAQKGSKAAKGAIQATKLLASEGHPDAIKGLAVLHGVVQQRKQDGVPAGQRHPELAKIAIPKAQLTRQVTVKPADRGFFVRMDGVVERRGV